MISEQIRPTLVNQFGRDILITHNQQHYNHAYRTSQGRYDLNGYEIPLQINNGSDGAVFASNGGTNLLLGLDNQYKSNLKPFREDKYSFDIHLWLLSHPDLRNNAKVQIFKKFFLDEIQSFITNKISKYR